jgi:hypothetical protein
MARTRSPNYPYVGLPTAIERVRKIYDEEHQNRMSRMVVAKHLGFGGLNGISVSVISALAKYGLLAVIDDDLQVSDDALTILVDPPDSEERAQAIRRAALKPELFTELNKYFGGTVPSDVNLLAYLQKHGFTSNAATLAAKSFRETMQLISGQPAAPRGTDGKPREGEGMQQQAEQQRDGQRPPLPPAKLGERELTTGLLSKNASFRLIVSGEVGVKEIERLIAKLQLDKEILAEPEPNPPATKDSAVNTPSCGPSKLGAVLITHAQRARLREQGYSDEQIAKMKPEEAHQILGVQ